MAASAMFPQPISYGFEHGYPTGDQGLGLQLSGPCDIDAPADAYRVPIFGLSDRTALGKQFRGIALQWDSLADLQPPPGCASVEPSLEICVASAAQYRPGEESLYGTSVSPQDVHFNAGDGIVDARVDQVLPTYMRPDSVRHISKAQRMNTKTSGTPSVTSIETSAKEAAAASDRSERARHAAILRHTQVKESKAAGLHQTPKDVEREKNRIVAAKCGKKKRAANVALNDEYRAAAAANTSMKREQRELLDQLTFWRMLALQHISNGQTMCQCDEIQRYNTDQALRALYEMEGSSRLSSLCSSHDIYEDEQADLVLPTV